MAWYPQAIRKELPQNDDQDPLDPHSIVLHTAVSTSDSLYDFFNSPAADGVESHFYVRSDGTVEQYMSTTVQAHCQLDGNAYAISIETEDNGAADPDDIPPWTNAQLDALTRLCVWLCEKHDIPAVKCPTWNGRGIGYHAQFTSDTPPRWNETHACPAKERINQVPALVRRIHEEVHMPSVDDIWNSKLVPQGDDPSEKPDGKARPAWVLWNLEATQDRHGRRLKRINQRLDRIEKALDELTNTSTHKNSKENAA